MAFFSYLIYAIIHSMKHISFFCDENIYTSNLLDFYFKDLKVGVLDIETTGLNPSRNKFILGGLYTLEDKMLHQFFAENRQEEEAALRAYIAELDKLDMVITYNGKHFDMPFIAKRAAAYGIEFRLPYDLDLYLVLNGHSPIKKFVPNLKQKTVENYMGLWQDRTDEISGGESVELYNEFERTQDQALEEKILLHNSDDVLQLTRLLKVVSKSDFHKAMYHLGFPAGPLTVEKIRIEKDSLTVLGTQRALDVNYMGFAYGSWPVESHFDSHESAFCMKIPLIIDSGMAIIDLQAAGLDTGEFEIYPTCSSGFLAIEAQSDRRFMEINHFIKTFIGLFIKDIK